MTTLSYLFSFIQWLGYFGSFVFGIAVGIAVWNPLSARWDRMDRAEDRGVELARYTTLGDIVSALILFAAFVIGVLLFWGVCR